MAVLIIFAYQLVRLIKQCRSKHRNEGDFFCPAQEDLDISGDSQVSVDGVDPSSLLDEEDWNQGNAGGHRVR